MITFSEKAYQCPDDKSSASSPLFDWSEITNLCKLYAAALSEDSHVQKSLINHFESKLRTHQLDKETLRGLNLIYQELLNSKTSNDRKTQIALILQERVEHCTPGFSNGIFFITTQIKSKTLQDCLYQIRFDIVNKVAREYSDDVHQVNSFFSAAQKLGLGVKANNDIYSNHNFEVNRLRNAFKSEYHFLNILNKISEDIHTNFNLNKDRPDLFQASILQLLPNLEEKLKKLEDFENQKNKINLELKDIKEKLQDDYPETFHALALDGEKHLQDLLSKLIGDDSVIAKAKKNQIEKALNFLKEHSSALNEYFSIQKQLKELSKPQVQSFDDLFFKLKDDDSIVLNPSNIPHLLWEEFKAQKLLSPSQNIELFDKVFCPKPCKTAIRELYAQNANVQNYQLICQIYKNQPDEDLKNFLLEHLEADPDRLSALMQIPGMDLSHEEIIKKGYEKNPTLKHYQLICQIYKNQPDGDLKNFLLEHLESKQDRLLALMQIPGMDLSHEKIINLGLRYYESICRFYQSNPHEDLKNFLVKLLQSKSQLDNLMNIAHIPLADILFNQNITEVVQMSLKVGTVHAEKMINNCIEIQIDYLQKCDMKKLSQRLNQLSWEYYSIQMDYIHLNIVNIGLRQRENIFLYFSRHWGGVLDNIALFIDNLETDNLKAVALWMILALAFPLGFVLVPTVWVVDMFIILVYDVAALITRMIIPCLASLIFPFVSNPFTRCRDEILAMDVKEENATGLNLR